MMSIKFSAKCKKCETEEEFKYVGLEDSEFDCLRCGEKLKNEITTKSVTIANK
jgi:predicted nucleic acid-binding Zn ribbon protein